MSLTKSIHIRPRKYKPKSKLTFKKLLVQGLILIFILSLAGGGGLYLYISSTLPDIATIADYKPKIITKIYSDSDVQIGEFAVEKREVIPISKVPNRLIQAFVAAEDDRFFEHEGLDFISILRAFIINVRAGGVVQGGSTITQQVAKSLLTSDRTLKRKVKEAILAYRIENRFSKNDILYLYLNQIYLGHGAYGVQAAAKNYFNKNVEDLDLAEMAILAGLPQAPSKYSPASNPEKARERQTYVLDRMVEEGYINIVEATDALNTKIEVQPLADMNNKMAPYFTEHVRRYLEKKYGADVLYEEGLKVFTTLNIEMQKSAQKALKEGLQALDKRQGYRGPERNVAEEERAAFLEELEKELEKNPIQEGNIYTGLVKELKSDKKTVIVDLGKDTAGRIPLNEMDWARKPDPEIDFQQGRIKNPADVLAVGDVIKVRVLGTVDKSNYLLLSLHQEPLAQAAILAMNPHNGFVKVMVGGYDFAKSKFNRAVQSRRQPGSAFKPIVYSAALDNGFTPASIIVDSPIIYESTEEEFTWKPKNYEDKFYGPTTLRNALIHSRNVVTIKIMQTLGLDYVIDYARRMGISSHLNKDLSLSLGSSGLSLIELTSAYSLFPAGGKKNIPIFITKVVDRDGNVLEEMIKDSSVLSGETDEKESSEGDGEVKNDEAKDETITEETDKILEEENAIPEALRNLPEGYAISPQTAYLMTSILQGVVQHGTGWRAKSLNRPVAGKTGTTNDLYDAWFMGFTPDLVAGTWVGFDQEAPLGKHETGSRAASPIFVDFMKDIYTDKPIDAFPTPSGIVFAKIDSLTGLLASPEQTENVIYEAFREGTAPTKTAMQAEVDAGSLFREEF